MPGSRVRGDRAFVRLLKQMPAAVNEEAADILDAYGERVLAAQRADAPVKSGKLLAGLSKKLLRKSLRLRVGLVGTPRGRAKLFYGFIVEQGRKAQTVNVTRKRGVAPYKLRVKARAAQHFVYKKRPDLRSDFQRRIGLFWNDVLARAGEGTLNGD